MFKRLLLILSALFLVLILGVKLVPAATFSTKNFTVTTSDPRLAEQMADRSEKLRAKLAIFWLGKELPNWYKRCKIHIQIGENLLAGGSTTFTFNRGEVYGWDMQIQGNAERVYDSVLPHEITHMILASHFRTPLPRWADEGAATFTEHESERNKYRNELYKALKNQQGIPLDKLFTLQDYPQNPMPLYAHGFSVAEFLIRQRGPHYFISFVEATLQNEKTWNELVYEFYGYESLRNLQNDWVEWVKKGTPDFVGSNMVAGNGTSSKQRLTVQNRLDEAAYGDSVNVVPESQARPANNLVIWSTTHVNSASGAEHE